MMNASIDDNNVPLSEREREILQLVATGATNQQIAGELDIALNTVKVHLRNIFAKINVSSRTEASLYALRAGLLEENQAVVQPFQKELVEEERDIVQEEPVTASPAETEMSVILQQPETPENPETPETLETPETQAPRQAETPVMTEATQAGSDTVTTPPATTAEQVPAVAQTPAHPPWHRFPIMWVFILLLVVTGIAVGVAVYVVASSTPSQQAIGTSLPASSTTPSQAQTVSSSSSARTSAWQTLATMSTPRTNFGLGSYDRKIYLIGGETTDGVSDLVERYNPASNSWVQLAPLSTPVADIQVVEIGSRLYVAGGRLASGNISKQFIAYDPNRDQWSSLPDLPAPRSQYAAVTMNGKYYLFGGWDGTAYRADIWVFDPDTQTWDDTAQTPMPEARGRMSVSIVGETIHLLGGQNNAGPLTLHHSYQPARDRKNSNPWRALPPLPQPVQGCVAVTVIENIYIFNPSSGKGMVYDTVDETWRSFETPLPPSASSLSALMLGTNIYLIGKSNDAQADGFFHFQYQAIYHTQLPSISK